jgi:hypothetical protein
MEVDDPREELVIGICDTEPLCYFLQDHRVFAVGVVEPGSIDEYDVLAVVDGLVSCDLLRAY